MQRERFQEFKKVTTTCRATAQDKTTKSVCCDRRGMRLLYSMHLYNRRGGIALKLRSHWPRQPSVMRPLSMKSLCWNPLNMSCGCSCCHFLLFIINWDWLADLSQMCVSQREKRFLTAGAGYEVIEVKSVFKYVNNKGTNWLQSWSEWQTYFLCRTGNRQPA